MLYKSITELFGCLVYSLVLCSSAFAVQQADFSWLSNGEPNLAGYKIYYGTASSQYQTSVDVGNPDVVNGVVQATVSGLADGITYYFTATAYDTDGSESDYSQEVTWTSSPSDDALIIDNGDPETSMSGSWSLSGGVNYYGTQSVYSKTVNGAYTYTANISGSYELSLWWTEWSSRCTNAPIEVYDNNTLIDSFDINQQNNGEQWNVAGDYDFIGPVSVVVISKSSSCSTNADAVRFMRTTTIAIIPSNDAPVAEEQLVFTNEDQNLKGSLTAYDADDDSVTYAIGSDASNGSVVLSADGSYSYTPDADFNGSDSFTFQVNDGLLYSNSAIVNISINPVNDVPVAYDDSVNVQKNQTASGILQGSDIDSGQLTYSIVSNGFMGTAAIVDPAIGTYTYTPNESAYGEDSFQFIVSDGSGKSNQATIHITIQQETASFAMEIGEINVDGTWTFVSFAENFRDPVVVAKPASNNDPAPCVVRIRNVSSNGFEIRLQNYDYIAEEHGLEQIGYIAVEQGSFILENGKRVEAGMFNTDLSDYPETIAFLEQFPVMPVVAASIVTENGYDAVVSRVGNITENGFDHQMQEQEANSALHTSEEVAYIAWEPFTGMIGNFAFEINVYQDEVNDQWQGISFQQGFDKPPILIAGMQSHYGRDTANLRHAKLNANGVQIRVAEEQSIDSETYHVFETLGFVAISNIDLEGDAVVEPTEEPVATVITLEVNASKIRGKRTAELYWSGAGGDSVQITRISENNEVFTVTVPIENYYKEILGKRGTYTYQVCATEGSVCSDVITVEL